MLLKTAYGWHCTECGREYTDEDELTSSDPCPSDDCPSNDEGFDDGALDQDVNGCDMDDICDAGDVFDIEYDH